MTRFVLTASLALALGAGLSSPALAQEGDEKNQNVTLDEVTPPAKLDDPKKNDDVVPDEENPPPKKNAPAPKKNNYAPRKNNYTPKKNDYAPPKKNEYTPPKQDEYTPPKKECTYKKVVSYQPVICHEYRQEPYTRCVTRYDHCGYPYTAEVTYYRTVRVAVKKWRAVVRYVKVCSY